MTREPPGRRGVGARAADMLPGAAPTGPPGAHPIRPGDAASTEARRGRRRARLAVRRIDPRSAMKVGFVCSLAALVVLLVAVLVLYLMLSLIGVIGSLRGFIGDIAPGSSGEDVAAYLSPGGALTVALVVGLVDIVLLTALATLAAYVYNVSAEIVGGVEVTLVEPAEPAEASPTGISWPKWLRRLG